MRSNYPLKVWTGAFILALLSFTSLINAQIQPSENLDEYFDDGGMSERKNIISTNLLAPIFGELGLRYERALTKRFSIEVGLKKMAPFYFFELLLPINDQFHGFAPSSGWGYSFAPHFYFWDKAPEFHYIGPRFAQRTHALEDGAKLRVTDFTIDYGYNLFLSKQFMFCYDIGIGYRRMDFDAIGHTRSGYRGVLQESTGTIYMNWVLGIGLIF